MNPIQFIMAMACWLLSNDDSELVQKIHRFYNHGTRQRPMEGGRGWEEICEEEEEFLTRTAKNTIPGSDLSLLKEMTVVFDGDRPLRVELNGEVIANNDLTENPQLGHFITQVVRFAQMKDVPYRRVVQVAYNLGQWSEQGRSSEQ